MQTTSKQLSHAEQHILDGLGGQPWGTAARLAANLPQAHAVWDAVRVAAGFRPGHNGWVTTDKTNVKLGKAGIPTIGVTLHPARGGIGAWLTLGPAQRKRFAAAVGMSVGDLENLLRSTLCPCSTPGCRGGCVVGMSANGQMRRSQLARLTRTIVTMAAPDAALAMTADHLSQLTTAHGKDKARWRVNVADDIRWELLAPGLWDVAPKAYTYTKWSPAERPGRNNLSLVYSASERWDTQDIVDTAARGHRVAVVFGCKKGELPTTWAGIPVVDGDTTDDLWVHPAGCIVGLAVKGPTQQMREAAVRAGFAFPVVPKRSIRLVAA